MSAPPRLDEVQIGLDAHVATLTLNRPEQRNALSDGMLRELGDAFRWAASETDARVVVITGAGDRAFCAGADLGSFEADIPEIERHWRSHRIVELFFQIEELGKPLVGRINGHALAGGFGLACACDLLIAAENATFGTPEVNVGVWPMMIQAILSRNLPRKVVLEMMMLGSRWTAEQMRSVGLVNRVVPLEMLDTAVAEITSQLAQKSPIVMKLGRDSFYTQQDMDYRAALEYLHGQLSLVSLTDDAREGVLAFFEKRAPKWQGR